MTMVMIALGAALGAPARYLTERTVRLRWPVAFPAGTFVVNMVACVVIAAVAGAAAHLDSSIRALIGPGFCATLSTYSGFNQETLALTESGRRLLAAVYVTATLAVGVAAAWVGWWMGT